MGVNISVLMPCYNASDFLNEAIDSVLSQTYRDFEFIIIDDASTDDSYEIIKKYAKVDNRIKYFKNDENIGNAATRNRGFKICTGDWIAEADADDIVPNDRLEKQINYAMANPKVKAIFGTYQFIDLVGKLGEKVIPPECTTKEIKAALFFRDMLPQGTAFLNREYLLRNKLFYDENFRVIQDYKLWSEWSFLDDFEIYKFPDTLELYRYNPNGVSVLTRKKKQKMRNKFFNEIHMMHLKKWGFELRGVKLLAYLYYINPEFHKRYDILLKFIGIQAIHDLEKQAIRITDDEMRNCFLNECKRFY